ncbi:MAG: Rid family hydrolase [Pseudomonadota bacterium]
MSARALVPAGSEAAVATLQASPGIAVHGLVFLTGMTGSRPDGSMPEGLDAQVHSAFAKIAAVLGEAGLTLGAMVEMTSYHIGLRPQFERFQALRAAYVSPPYPAWTALEVAGLRRAGALFEIRVVAAHPEKDAEGNEA